MNEEYPVSASHKLALITSLPFVHTARRYYRLNGLVRPLDRNWRDDLSFCRFWENRQTWSFRGSKSRNKVSVGEPAEGSLRGQDRLFFETAGRNNSKKSKRCLVAMAYAVVLFLLGVQRVVWVLNPLRLTLPSVTCIVAMLKRYEPLRL